MDPLAAHAAAQDTFAGVLAAVADDAWSLPTPCEEWDVATLVEHVIGGNQRVQLLAERTPVALPDDRQEALRTSAAAAQDVFAADDGLTRPFALPFGTVPGRVFIGIRTGDALTHAWDLARAIGQPPTFDAELVAHTLATARAFLQPSLRGPGRPFGPEQPCPDDRPPADRLAAFLGRSVD